MAPPRPLRALSLAAAGHSLQGDLSQVTNASGTAAVALGSMEDLGPAVLPQQPCGAVAQLPLCHKTQ